MPFDASSTLSPSNVIFRKTKMCKFHMMGRCMRNDACTYAHSAAELEPLPNFHFTKMCPSLIETGSCARGAACTFAHQESDLRAPTRAQAAAQGATPNGVPGLAVPVPAETLISMQQVLAGMGVVLLQVLPLHKPVEEQGPASADGGVLDGVVKRRPSVSWSRQSTEEPGNVAYADVDADAGVEVDADADADWDLVMCDNKPSRSWSRQSTEEGFEEPLGEFSRQNSESSEAWSLEEAPAGEGGEPAGVEAMGLGRDLGECGLAYTVKNTFLQFDDQEIPPPVLRRVLSTGSCAVRDS